MKCDERMIENYLNCELDAQSEQALIAHLQHCPACQEFMTKQKQLNEALQDYKNEEIDVVLLHNLRQIQYSTEKKFSLFHLYPKEFALSAASVIVSLCAGALFSFSVVSTYANDSLQNIDYFEEISLTSLVDY